MNLTALLRKRNPPVNGCEQYTLESALWQLKASCTHHGRKMLRVCLALVRREAHALADVRTLDAWAAARRRNVPQVQRDPGGGTWTIFLHDDLGNERLPFTGATPDEARAKAAAWVREQVAKGWNVNHPKTDLAELMRRALEAFAALTPEQQAAFRREQAIDWAYGNLKASTNHGEGVARDRIPNPNRRRKGRLNVRHRD